MTCPGTTASCAKCLKRVAFPYLSTAAVDNFVGKLPMEEPSA
jgi:hypothetical protein